jgi:hypothetical protein
MNTRIYGGIMAEKKLKLALPPIIGYLHHAYQLSVAQQHPSFNDWFYSNYIQLTYHPETGWLNFFLARLECYPLVYYQLLNIQIFINNNIDIVDFIINCINSGYYIWLYLDEFYVPNRISYNTGHLIHECLIYGYNTDKSCFYSAGFDTRHNYSFSEISYTDFIKAFYNSDINKPVNIVKHQETDRYNFDIQNVMNLLEDYVYSKNTSKRLSIYSNPTSDVIYGLQIYEYLRKNFENPPTKEFLDDIRSLHILWEHKKCMTSRIKFLYENKYLDKLEPYYSKYKEIENKALALRNMQIKYTYTRDDDEIKKIATYIDEIRNEEKEILVELLECIRK